MSEQIEPEHYESNKEKRPKVVDLKLEDWKKFQDICYKEGRTESKMINYILRKYISEYGVQK